MTKGRSKREFNAKECEKTVRSLLISEIVDLEKSIDYKKREIERDDSKSDKIFLTAMLAIDEVKLEALRLALVEDDFSF